MCLRSLNLHDAPSRHKGTFHPPKAWRLDSAPCHAVSLDRGSSPCPAMHQLCAALSTVLPKFVLSDFVLFETGVSQHSWPPAPTLLPPLPKCRGYYRCAPPHLGFSRDTSLSQWLCLLPLAQICHSSSPCLCGRKPQGQPQWDCFLRVAKSRQLTFASGTL